MSYEEIDYTFSSHGERVCSHPGVSDAHDETECARCGTLVAHRLGEDPETGRPTEGWVPCYSGPLGIVCENCAVALDPVDARNFDLGVRR